MKIHQYSTFPYGGAGTAALRHHLELRRRGVDSRFFCRNETEWNRTEPSVQPAPFVESAAPTFFLAKRRYSSRRRRIIDQFERHLRHRPTTNELVSPAELLEETRLDRRSDPPDVVHLHWLAFLVDYPTFFGSLPTDLPIVWTLHDMNPLTGGCHYDAGCGGFTRGCGNCPQMAQPARRDLSHVSFRLKKQALAGRNIFVVSPSRWLDRLARQSPMWPAKTRFSVIPYGLDLAQFHPVDKEFARLKLGLPPDTTLLAFGADDVNNHRKGFHSLVHALRLLQGKQNFECIVFGKGKLPDDRSTLPKFHDMGFIEETQQQALIYSAADMFVMPSLEDNLPLTGLEAMACGTPVIAYEVGGIPEYVLPGQTGLLAESGNAGALARQIADLAAHPRLGQRLGAGARRWIEAEHDLQHRALEYIELYAELSGRTLAPPRREAA